MPKEKTYELPGSEPKDIPTPPPGYAPETYIPGPFKGKILGVQIAQALTSGEDAIKFWACPVSGPNKGKATLLSISLAPTALGVTKNQMRYGQFFTKVPAGDPIPLTESAIKREMEGQVRNINIIPNTYQGTTRSKLGLPGFLSDEEMAAYKPIAASKEEIDF